MQHKQIYAGMTQAHSVNNFGSYALCLISDLQCL